jgi:acetyl esterase/lipase
VLGVNSVVSYESNISEFSARRAVWRLLPHRIALTTSIAYADGARHTLDLCRPKSATAAPVIVFFYGGGWRSGSKEPYRRRAIRIFSTMARWRCAG